MIVISLTRCPPKLRGDLSKWLMEISTGVYVGNVSARVREALWKRITDCLKEGQAAMVWSANNEQGMTCRVHNTGRLPVDYDGYTLMKTPNPLSKAPEADSYHSTEHYKRFGKRNAKKQHSLPEKYVILDLETTGLSPLKDCIIEIGIMVIFQGAVQNEYSRLLQCAQPIPLEVQKLTGITDEMCAEQGMQPADVLNEIYDLIDGTELVCWHASFDIAFLENAFEKHQFVLPDFHFTDAEALAKQTVGKLSDYKMKTVAAHLGINSQQQHRALPDCQMLYGILCKLNEIA